MTGGRTAEELAAELGVSPTTARRRRREARQGELQKRRTAAAVEDIPESSDDIPSGTTLEKLNYWLAIVERRAKQAENQGDFDTLVKMSRLAAVFLEAVRKATPPKVSDPNDDPDLIVLAGKVRERWHTLITNLACGPLPKPSPSV